MKFTLIFIFFLFFISSISSQQTKKYEELTKNLKFIDSVNIIKRFNNGKIKEVYSECIYEFGDYEYTYRCSKNLLYNRKGSLLAKYKYDNYGSLLASELLNKKKQIYSSIKTIEIDNVSKSIKEFLKKERNFKIKVFQKEYYACKNDSLILYQEGYKLNRKKIGVWKTFNCCDSTFKEKNHSK